MPFLGSKNGHEPCSVRIQEYLERDDRALAHDFVNLVLPDETRAWAYFMDRTRHEYGNDRNVKGKAVMYRHFIISPDPRDSVDLETLRGLTMDWVHHFFGDIMNPGLLGSYEVAVVYHDDNKNHIPHAHIIVNNTNLDTGLRLHIDTVTNANLMPDKLQELAKARGLSFFDNDRSSDNPITSYNRYYTKAERDLRRRGRFVWKDDLANMVDIAKHLSANETSFLNELKDFGVEVHESKSGDYVYTHPSNPQRWSCVGRKLGKSFTKESVEKFHDTGRQSAWKRVASNEKLVENISAEVSTAIADFDETIRLAAVVPANTRLEDIHRAVVITDNYGFLSEGEFRTEISKLRKRAEKASSDYRESLLAEADEIEKALSVVEDADFFDGIVSPRKTRPSDSSSSSSSSASRSGGRTRSGSGKPKHRNRGLSASGKSTSTSRGHGSAQQSRSPKGR